MISVALRLKDAIWSLRRRYGMESDIDRIIKYLVFEQDLSRDQLESILVVYPKRIPEDFRSALIARIQRAIRNYWSYHQTRKNYHRVLRDIRFLETVAGVGFEGCRLVYNKNTGYQLELRKI